MLTEQLYEHNRRAEEACKELAEVRERLAESEETIAGLKGYGENLKAASENGQVRWDVDEESARAKIEQLSSRVDEDRLALAELQRTHAVLQETRKNLWTDNMEDKLKWYQRMERLSADNDRLAAELERREATKAKWLAKIEVTTDAMRGMQMAVVGRPCGRDTPSQGDASSLQSDDTLTDGRRGGDVDDKPSLTLPRDRLSWSADFEPSATDDGRPRPGSSTDDLCATVAGTTDEYSSEEWNNIIL